MPDAAANSPVTVYGLSISSIVTMFCTAQMHMTMNTPTKNTRLINVRRLMRSTPCAVGVAEDEPRVDLRELVRDGERDPVDEVVHPVEEDTDLLTALGDLAEDGVDLLHLQIHLLDVGIEHFVVLCLDDARQRRQRVDELLPVVRQQRGGVGQVHQQLVEGDAVARDRRGRLVESVD